MVCQKAPPEIIIQSESAVENTNINEIGATAFIIAGIRALEETRENPMFSDPYAKLFLNPELRETARQLTQVHFAVGDAIRLRTLAFNVIVESGIRRGVRQIVTLGSGFDMRHRIFAKDDVRFFDVDQPAVLDFKASVLANADILGCTAIRCNYLQADLAKELISAGLEPAAETLIIWEGNTMYLPGELIMSFLNRLCESLSRFRIGFDYFPQSVLDGTYESEEAMEIVRDVQKVMNVTFMTGFDSLQSFETEAPFRIIETGNVIEIGTRLGGPGTDEKIGETAMVTKELAGCYRIALLERG
ncbi:MAG: class I SAM-dependent methyltransferase [Gammaproteobacteria bacterium]|nr:class I SAM-dependent methyltransferase [Gammaproteobacteria bacterium]